MTSQQASLSRLRGLLNIISRAIIFPRSVLWVRPDDLVDIAVYHKVHFNSTNEQGVVFHLDGPMSQYGKTGVTCIGNTLEEAKSHHQRTIDALDFETPTDGTITTRLETL